MARVWNQLASIFDDSRFGLCKYPWIGNQFPRIRPARTAQLEFLKFLYFLRILLNLIGSYNLKAIIYLLL